MKVLPIIFLAAALTVNLSAQTTDPTEYNWYKDKNKNYHARYTVSFQAFHLLYTALRLDGEYRLKDTRHWLQLGLTAYPFTNDKISADDPYSYNKYGWLHDDEYGAMNGYGVDFNYKFFPLRYLYVAGGPSWHHFNFRYLDYGWNQFKEDGVEYHVQVRDVWKQTVNRIDFNVMIGFQKISRHSVLFDAYGGISFRKAFHKYPDLRHFDSSGTSHGYTGETFILGIRLGFAGKPRY
ncbi:MAG: hypothetical protein LBU62_11475 [Bacteroidales bacterium]|jgi:hypothetical protein|nr:hypothetical protein [Bacteroidales bacterium]